MKKLSILSAIFLTFVLNSTIFPQTPGILWITRFSPGSTNLNDPNINKSALATLDSLMQNENIKVTFLGAADEMRWNINGEKVHKNVSDALNDAKRIGRARALRERYNRGKIGITHEFVAGVKVIWTYKDVQNSYSDLQLLQKQNRIIQQELQDLKSVLHNLKPEKYASKEHNGINGINGNGGNSEIIVKEGLKFNWRFQTGLWSWQSGSNGGLLSPSIALNIIFGKTAFIIQGGVTPWHFSTKHGEQSESFIYAGLKYFKSDKFGFSVGGFRGWEFFTSTDNWSFKTTGISTGIIFTYGRIELNPMLTFSSISTLETNSQNRIGGILGVNVNIN